VRVRDNGLLTDFVGLEGVSTVASELVIDGNRAAADPGTPPHSGTAQRERDSVCVCVCVSAPGDTRVQGSSNCMGRGGNSGAGPAAAGAGDRPRGPARPHLHERAAAMPLPSLW
jgi:hypothetical protein